MRGYAGDDVEEYDEYEEEGEDHYEEDEEGEEEDQEEERKPTEEELEYLELRKRLKERYRKNIKKENGSASSKTNRLPYDNYGSFFGPSQPVISQRVIQESKSLLETQHLAYKVPNTHRHNEKTFAPSASKVGVQRLPPKFNEVQRKAQKLKVSRDYSFLSDDAQLPASRKEPPARNVYVPNSEARPGQVPPKSKLPLGNSGRNVHGIRDERKPVSSNGQTHSKAAVYKLTTGSKSNLMSVDSRKQQSRNNDIGPGRPTGPKAPSKMPMASVEKKAFAPDSGAKNHLPSVKPKNDLPTAKNHLSTAKNHLPSAKNQFPSTKIPPSSKIIPSVQKKHLEQRNGIHEPYRSRPISKQPVTSSKPQINKPLKQMSSHATTQDHRPKKKPLRRYSDDGDGDDDAKAFSMLRSILGPRKFATYDDDDDSDMEAGFDDIMEEEEQSAQIALKEDEEQLRLIEEEERQERKRMLAKKRKLMSQH